jgi:hypothetical protein
VDFFHLWERSQKSAFRKSRAKILSYTLWERSQKSAFRKSRTKVLWNLVPPLEKNKFTQV